MRTAYPDRFVANRTKAYSANLHIWHMLINRLMAIILE